MRTVEYESFGKAHEVLTVRDRAAPDPGPGEVRIRLRMAPIHNHDIATIRGVYGYRPELPATPGTEAVGTVDALGSDVSGIEIGQRVSVTGVTGAWAEQFVAPRARLLPVPDALPDTAAAQLTAMPLSASALLRELGIRPGEWLVQNAANGAVGRTVAVLAAARGVNVVHLVRRDAGRTELADAGIESAVSTETPGWADRVREVTAGAPIGYALDSIGGRAANDLLELVAPGGRLMSFGAMSGRPVEIDTGNLLFKGTTVQGFWVTRWLKTVAPADLTAMLGEIAALALSGALSLPVEATYDLADVRIAAKANAAPGRRGKIMLTA